MIKVMPFFEYSVIWISLLGASRKWGNEKLWRLSLQYNYIIMVQCHMFSWLIYLELLACKRMQTKLKP